MSTFLMEFADDVDDCSDETEDEPDWCGPDFHDYLRAETWLCQAAVEILADPEDIQRRLAWMREAQAWLDHRLRSADE